VRGMRGLALCALAGAALACGGLGRTSRPGGYSMQGDLLHLDLWCEPQAMFLAVREPDLSPCLPPGLPVGAARLELRPGSAPVAQAEVGPGFGACAAERLGLSLVLYEHTRGYPEEMPPPQDARCEGIFAYPVTAEAEAWAAARSLLPPENAADRFWKRVDSVLMPAGHL
jgi:hypothetical protein